MLPDYLLLARSLTEAAASHYSPFFLTHFLFRFYLLDLLMSLHVVHLDVLSSFLRNPTIHGNYPCLFQLHLLPLVVLFPTSCNVFQKMLQFCFKSTTQLVCLCCFIVLPD